MPSTSYIARELTTDHDAAALTLLAEASALMKANP